jgi:hypothetical protein
MYGLHLRDSQVDEMRAVQSYKCKCLFQALCQHAVELTRKEIAYMDNKVLWSCFFLPVEAIIDSSAYMGILSSCQSSYRLLCINT